MPTVSVVIPTYESAGELPRAIDSVIDQTYDDLEIIVVDGGSEDDTVARARAYGDRVTCIRHEENRGVSAARNTGLMAAEGRYVAFLDADDEWRPSKLERQLSVLEGRGSEWFGVYCGYRPQMHGATRLRRRLAERVPLAGGGTTRAERAEGGEELIPLILAIDLDLGGASTLLVRRSAAVGVGGFDERLGRHEDWEFLVRLLRRGKLAHLDEELVIKHESGLYDADTVADSKRRYFSKLVDDVDRATRQGYDVAGPHRVHLALCYLREGRFRKGIAQVRAAGRPTDQQAFHLAWAAAVGSVARLRRALATDRPAEEPEFPGVTR